MNENEFDQHADRTLRALVTALDAIEDVEAELSQGVLNVFLPKGPEYVINSHRAAGQIWMAAGRQAWHFAPDDTGERWTSTKAPHEELWVALSGALAASLGRPVRLTGGAA
jgi:CyaY protein